MSLQSRMSLQLSSLEKFFPEKRPQEEISPILPPYDPEEFQGKSWYEITMVDEVNQKISEKGVLNTSLGTLEKYYFPEKEPEWEEQEYPFSPDYQEYRKRVTTSELDRQLDGLSPLKGAGCIFYNIDHSGNLHVLLKTLEMKNPQVNNLVDIGGEFCPMDTCAFTCAKRNVEESFEGEMSMTGTEELCDESIKTHYFVYFKEILRDTPFHKNIRWYKITPPVFNRLTPRIRPLIRLLEKRAEMIKKEIEYQKTLTLIFEKL